MPKAVAENLELNKSVSAIRKALKETGRPLSQFKKEFEARQNIDASAAAQWKKANSHALKSSNDFIKKNGLPLTKYRLF
ncbi:MAG: type II toxin-antitoxin system CcdA family antitoxin [Gammaproteobacteria bacterium]|nr:type II toxin-antitoxin system CcdA family antitoxin [Gammaproteobacteria bacterium]